MNFELKTLSLAAAAKSPTDVLIVLISDHFQAAKDPLSLLIEKALKAKDFSSKKGKVLHAYGSSRYFCIQSGVFGGRRCHGR